MEENKPIQESAVRPKKNNKAIVIIIVLVAVVVVQGIKIYLDHQESIAKEDQLANTEEELAITMQRLTNINEELALKIAEIEQLGGNVEELEQAKAEIEAELSKSRRTSRRTIQDLKDKADGYELLLKAKDVEIEKLKEINDELLTENTSLKTEKNVLNDSLTQLNESKEELASKVAQASQLKAENIQIFAINSRGKERESPFKARQAEKIKVVFNIAENEVAPIEGKNILVRILDANEQVIFDVAKGSGTFMYNNKEAFYTANQEILFDNSRQQLTFEYEKGSEYEPGVYQLEVYTEDYKMGSTSFEVK
ncbi:chromosome segregation protein SMC [Fulvivirga sp. M361]|uniref:chromosome segregation protein SMC n=1 Tax=Fulvivirga sp. M361 TaxID=2594266 RepID=UPI0011799996|nr:chromosome segregation protein SMC [Fulvivirga sp. M361]TRX61720.1 chromosome segregation protein SMC [Fulvivirga sp. M361]